MFLEDFLRRPIAIKRDDTRQSALVFERPAEKCLCRNDVPLRAGEEIDRLSFLVNRTVTLSPVALDLHLRLVDPPGIANSACEAVPAFAPRTNSVLQAQSAAISEERTFGEDAGALGRRGRQRMATFTISDAI